MAEVRQIHADFPPKMDFLFRPHRWKVAYGGRDSAKSWSFARALLIQGLEKQERVLCTREFQNSIKDSVHSLLDDQIRSLDLGGHYQVKEKEIVGRGNTGTSFSFYGLHHNVEERKSFEGADKCWVEEAATVRKKSWDTLEPTIRKPGSEIWVSFNADLETDETYKRFVVSPPPDCKVVKLTWQDNPWASEVLANGREHMRITKPDDYDWIWQGNCRKMLEGAIFADELRAAESEGRITQVPYDPSIPVDTFWDLGWADHTAIWFVQSAPMVFRVIDFYQNRLKHVQHYLSYLQSRGYVYRRHHLPHDAQTKHPEAERTWKAWFDGASMPSEVIERTPNKRQAIDAARAVFPKCYFDANKCADGLQGLRHYRFDLNDDGILSKLPLHDAASNPADAFLCLGQAVQGPSAKKLQQINYPNLGNSMTARHQHFGTRMNGYR